MATDDSAQGSSLAAPAVVSQTSEYGRGPGWSVIKPEFLLSKEEYLRRAAARTIRADSSPPESGNSKEGEAISGDSADVGSHATFGGGQKGRGQNHGRNADELGLTAGLSRDSSFCRSIMAGRACKFGDKCRDSHDLAAYLLTKPPDLGPRCYVFDTHGRCPGGVSCRYGDSHTDRTTGAQTVRPAVAAVPAAGSVEGPSHGSEGAAAGPVAPSPPPTHAPAPGSLGGPPRHHPDESNFLPFDAVAALR